MIFEVKPVRRTLCELTRKTSEIQLVSRLERRLSDLVLLEVMGVAKTDAPVVRGLHPHASVGAAANVSAFDWKLPAAPHGAAVTPHPRAMRRAVAGRRLARFARQTSGKAQLRHPPSPAVSAAVSATCFALGRRFRGFAGVRRCPERLPPSSQAFAQLTIQLCSFAAERLSRSRLRSWTRSIACSLSHSPTMSSMSRAHCCQPCTGSASGSAMRPLGWSGPGPRFRQSGCRRSAPWRSCKRRTSPWPWPCHWRRAPRRTLRSCALEPSSTLVRAKATLSETWNSDR